jgi:hypothetical protein
MCLTRLSFHFRCVEGNLLLLIQAFRKKFIIPEFDAFAKKINEIYKTVEKQRDGHVKKYFKWLFVNNLNKWLHISHRLCVMVFHQLSF